MNDLSRANVDWDTLVLFAKNEDLSFECSLIYNVWGLTQWISLGQLYDLFFQLTGKKNPLECEKVYFKDFPADLERLILIRDVATNAMHNNGISEATIREYEKSFINGDSPEVRFEKLYGGSW